MPKKMTVYDREQGKPLERFAVTAREMVTNDPGRYSFSPWKSMKVSAKDAKAADEAAARAVEANEAKEHLQPRTNSAPRKALPVGREDSGARVPEPDNPELPAGTDPLEAAEIEKRREAGQKLAEKEVVAEKPAKEK